MNYPIDSGIKPPKKYSRVDAKPKYPFLGMKPGDSFAVEPEAGASVGTLLKRMNHAIYRARKATGFKFLMRPDKNTGGVRIWRTK